MPFYRVEFSDRAQRELESILAWLLERSHAGARAWMEQLENSVSSIAENPHSAPLAPENVDHQAEIRHFLFKTRHGSRYRLLLTIIDDVVYITNVRGSGQQPVAKDELGRPNE